MFLTYLHPKRGRAPPWGCSYRPRVMEMVSRRLYVPISRMCSSLFIPFRCFWINLCALIIFCLNFVSYRYRRPTGGFAGLVLFFFLNLNPHQGMSLQQHLSQFDFLGLALLMSGVICFLIGLNSGETNCMFPLYDLLCWLIHRLRVFGRNHRPPLCWMRAIDSRLNKRDVDYKVTHHSSSIVQGKFVLFKAGREPFADIHHRHEPRRSF